MDDVLELPGAFSAGTTVTYRRSFAGYPADDGWTLTLYIAGKSVLAGATYAIDRGTFVVTIPAAETAKLEPGIYSWEEHVTKAGATYIAASGRVVIRRNIATATKGEFSSWAQGALYAVECRISGRTGVDIESYQIDGMAVSRIPFKDLFDLRDRLQRMVNDEAGQGAGPILIEFNRTGYDV